LDGLQVGIYATLHFAFFYKLGWHFPWVSLAIVANLANAFYIKKKLTTIILQIIASIDEDLSSEGNTMDLPPFGYWFLELTITLSSL